MPSGRQARKAGITHFPLSSERSSQKRVPPRKTEERSPRGKSGHRLSRKQDPEAASTPESTFRGKGGKGGKTRGSRAGLLAPSRKVRNRGR
jgi:hypothetical protein